MNAHRNKGASRRIEQFVGFGRANQPVTQVVTCSANGCYLAILAEGIIELPIVDDDLMLQGGKVDQGLSGPGCAADAVPAS